MMLAGVILDSGGALGKAPDCISSSFCANILFSKTKLSQPQYINSDKFKYKHGEYQKN